MATGTPHLGYVGRPLEGDVQLDTRLSRVGGKPSWLRLPSDNAEVRRADALACGLCCKPLRLVGQFSAEYAGAPRRLLHIFACQAIKCSGGSDARAWRVLRSTGAAAILAPASMLAPAPAAAPGAYPTTAFVSAADDRGLSLGGAGGDWGAGGTDEDWGASEMVAGGNDDWGAPTGDDWGASARAGDGADAEIDALLCARASASDSSVCPCASSKAKEPRREEAAAVESNDGALYRGVLWEPASEGVVTLPCYAVEIWNEPEDDKIENAAMLDHEKELLERYKQSDLAQEETGPAGLPPDIAAEAAEMEVDGSESAEVDEFGIDEDDEYLSSNERWLAKFQRRLERSSTQVVRYEWGGSPLWMVAPPQEIAKGSWPPPCGRCGAKRVFEVQVLPTLCGQLGTLAEWGTILAYTCSQDCAAEDPCEEFVAVQAQIL